MNPLVPYYLHQAGSVRGDNCMGPIYSNTPFLQRGHGIGIFWGGLWRSYVCPLLWKVANAVGSEAIVTGQNIISFIAQNIDPNAKIRDIVHRNMTESAHTVIKKLSGQGRKRKRATSTKVGGKVKKARKQLGRCTNKASIKRDIFL